jgi:hypothetical protein
MCFLERNIVVEIIRAWLRRSVSTTTLLATALLAAALLLAATTTERAATTGAATSAEHLHFVSDDLGRVAILAVLALPLACP